MGEEIEKVLLEQGVRAFPSLQGTQTADNIRFFQAGTPAASFIDILRYPDGETDRQLAEIVQKLKGN